MGVASLLVLFCRFFLFDFCFLFFMFVLLFVVLPVASSPGEGRRQWPGGGARQRFYCRCGYFSSTRRSFLCSLFFRSIDLLLCSCSVSLHISFTLFVPLFFILVYFILYIFVCFVLFCFMFLFVLFVFLFSLFQSIGWLAYVRCACHSPAPWHMALYYYCCLPGTT